MFGLQTLDIILGLVFTYFLLSLACTAINEMIAQWLSWRAHTLRQGIRGILSSNTATGVADTARAQAAAKKEYEETEKKCRDAAATEFDDYMKEDAAVATAEKALGEQIALEKAARRRQLRAENDLASALSGQVDSATLTKLQDEVRGATQEVTTLVEGTRTKADALNLAVEKRQAALDALRKKAESQVGELEKKKRALDTARGQHIAHQLYDHPIIKALSQPRFTGWFRKKQVRLPSYIPARAFRTALLDVIAPGAPTTAATLATLRAKAQTLPAQIARPLVLFLDSAGDDVDRFRTAIENWYEDTMERVSGFYKRKTQLVILIIAFFITLFTNADTLRITRALASNQALREAVVAQAQALANNPGEDINALLAAARGRSSAAAASGGATTSPAPQPVDSVATDSVAARDSLLAMLRADSIAQFRYRQIHASIDSLQNLGLPLGWMGPCTPRQISRLRADSLAKARKASTQSANAAPLPTQCFRLALAQESGPGRVVGLLLTMLAVSLGAPFWFDMLNKIVNIRSAGRAPEEKPKSPEALPPPTGAGK